MGYEEDFRNAGFGGIMDWLRDDRTGDEWMKASQNNIVSNGYASAVMPPGTHNDVPMAGSHNPPHPAPAPAPYVPPPPPKGQDQVNYIPVKIPEANIVTWNSNPVDADTLERLYFEDVGGTEILSVARHDTVGGEPVATTPIANLESIQLQFNPLNILTSTKAQQLFNQFAIDIDTHLYDSSDAVSLSEDDQYLIIQLDSLKEDEYVQIQVSGEGDEHWIYDEAWYNTGGGTE